MHILPSCHETLDSFLLKSHQIHKESLQKALELYDKEIYSQINHKRFVLIRLDERVLLSSYGILRFRRRYYYDSFMNEYCYLLDNRLQIPKSKRMTNELIIKMLDLASIMSYKEVGEHLSDEFVISKFTVWKTINEVLLETYFDVDIDRKNNKIHVQIDEKYIGMVGSKNKKKYYTTTIFAGKDLVKNRLLNKTVISSANLYSLKAKLSEILVERYKVSLNEEIFLSGDFATYIQNFEDSIKCCKVKYVPDKFHVYETMRDVLPDCQCDDICLTDASYQKYLIERLSKTDDKNGKKLKRILENNPKAFKTYLNPLYLGCSQEGQNSHIYAPRFGKYANRFSPSTIEKLALIREAKVMNAKIKIVYKTRRIPEPIDDFEVVPHEDIIKYVLDTREMKLGSVKMFNAIKYGGL